MKIGEYELNTKLLSNYLSEVGFELDIRKKPKLCVGGLANINIEVIVNGEKAILRKAPSGPLPKGAHDMVREHKVLSKLSKHFPLAPNSLHLCQDLKVLGAPFQLIEYRPGRVFRGEDLSLLNQGESMSKKLIPIITESMSRLHKLDPINCGLKDLGNPKGFIPRNAKRWSEGAIYFAEEKPFLKLAKELSRELQRTLADWNGGQPTFLHCDFKLDNFIIDKHELTPVALLDWDMTTLGDPLYDLATLLSYWAEPEDPACMQNLKQMPTSHKDFPTRDNMIEAYASATGRSVQGIHALRGLCLTKLAVVFLQLHARWENNTLGDSRYANFDDLGIEILEYARDVTASC
ncbi:phosphotransferase family protein [Hyphomicrobiales bacterium 4NK60-0047b]